MERLTSAETAKLIPPGIVRNNVLSALTNSLASLQVDESVKVLTSEWQYKTPMNVILYTLRKKGYFPNFKFRIHRSSEFILIIRKS